MKEESWPSGPPKRGIDEETIEAERARSQVLHVSTDNTQVSIMDLQNYSKLHFVLRVTAWIYRFASNCRLNRDRVHGPLTTSEINNAEIYWHQQVQREVPYRNTGTQEFWRRESEVSNSWLPASRRQ